MHKILYAVVVFSLILLSVASFAIQYSGDGTYVVKEGDTVVLGNGWKLDILGAFLAYNEERIHVRIYDANGGVSSDFEPISRLEGVKKFGTSTQLKLEIEVLGLSGQTSPTGSPLVTKYEDAQIRVASIDEALPSIIEQPPAPIEEVWKNLTYKDARIVPMRSEDRITLGNGYILEFTNNTYGAFGPIFNIYDSNGQFVDEIQLGWNGEVFSGSYIRMDSFSGDRKSANLMILNGTVITFGTGWTLFSIPIEDGDGYGTILESTCNNATIWSWNPDLGDYESVGKLQEGARIPAQRGMWVKIQTKNNILSNRDCEIIVSGRKSVTTGGIMLKAGWNVIPAPFSAYGKRTVFEWGSDFTLLNLDDVRGDCEFTKGPWQYVASENPGDGGFSKPLNNNLALDRAYFVNVSNDCTLSNR